MSYPPYGQNPYGQPPYGQPSSQPSAQNPGQQNPGWGGQPQGQPGWGGPPQGQPGWGQQPGWGGQPQGQPTWGQPRQDQGGQSGPGQHPGQPPQPVPHTPVPEPEPRRTELKTLDVVVTTTDTVPGREITETLGPVLGVVTRPRDMRPSADLAVILTETRQDAIEQLADMASRAGADAVVGLRFDGGKISDGASEVSAYGTAVKLTGGQVADEDEAGLGGEAGDSATEVGAFGNDGPAPDGGAADPLPQRSADGPAPEQSGDGAWQGQDQSAEPRPEGDQPENRDQNPGQQNPFVNL